MPDFGLFEINTSSPLFSGFRSSSGMTFTLDDASVVTGSDGSSFRVRDADNESVSGNVYGWVSTAPLVDGVTYTFQSVSFFSPANGFLYTDLAMPAGASNYIVDSTADNDLINAAYVDAEGDQIDNNDSNPINSGAAGGNNDSVLAGAGNDTVIAGVGDDTVDGGSSSDSVDGGNGEDSIIGGTGNDTIEGGFDGDTILGDIGDDVINGEQGADSIDGGSGNDSIDGATGQDTIFGGTGNDTIDAGGSFDQVSGGAGYDIINGGTNGDIISGGDGDDIIQLTNSFGNDNITGGEGAEVAGDTLDMSGLTDDVTVDLTSNDPEAGSVNDGASTANFTQIENIILGRGRDTIVLADGSGADQVNAFDMTDSGDGTTNDQLDVTGLTSDGGATPVNTNDVTVTDTNGDGTGDAILTFPGGESITLVGVTPAQVDTPTELEAIGIPAVPPTPNYIEEGTAGADLIDDAYTDDPEGDMVDAGDNLAGNDDDSIEAGDGDDTVRAGEGDDSVEGGAGNDSIFGFEGSDTVNGGVGDDVINTRTSPGAGVPDDGLTYPDDPGTPDDKTALYNYPSDTDPNNDRDSVFGGAGNDTILTGDDDDTIDGGTGDDVIDAGFDDDVIYGGVSPLDPIIRQRSSMIWRTQASIRRPIRTQATMPTA